MQKPTLLGGVSEIEHPAGSVAYSAVADRPAARRTAEFDFKPELQRVDHSCPEYDLENRKINAGR